VNGHSLILADPARQEQFALLGHTRRLFQDYALLPDDRGVAWAVKRVAGHPFDVTWLGPGWVFDPPSRLRRAEEFSARSRAVGEADPERHARELKKVLDKVRLGGHAERLLWAVHEQVRLARSSVVDPMDEWLAGKVWGTRGRTRPRHWRKVLLDVLRGLAHLHVGEWPEGSPRPDFGEGTALLTSVGDLRNDAESDVCDDHCPGRHGPAHHHYRVSIGRERLAGPDDGSGVRPYAFPDGGAGGAGLRPLGETGRLVSVYLPAKLGDPDVCARLEARRHRLLRAVVRETTRARRRTKRGPGKRRGGPARPEVFSGNEIVGFAGKGSLACGALDAAARHVGFNGNGVRRGQGYRLATAGGWMAKAGYGPGEVGAFLDDLAGLAESLSLTVVGVGNDSGFVDLGEMRAPAPPGARAAPALPRASPRRCRGWRRSPAHRPSRPHRPWCSARRTRSRPARPQRAAQNPQEPGHGLSLPAGWSEFGAGPWPGLLHDSTPVGLPQGCPPRPNRPLPLRGLISLLTREPYQAHGVHLLSQRSRWLPRLR
jgi:hypothetical protein